MINDLKPCPFCGGKAEVRGSLVCVGCGHEHNCSVHGCAVIRAAIAALEARSE